MPAEEGLEARIALLPELVRNQIAAGEVIERPASVVKELVENALDAGAGSVRVDLEEGGVRLVRVTDDGGGMGPADLELAFQAHATSKLGQVSDLDHIASLGFRGEALASMASIARCSILSRSAREQSAWQVTCEGGRMGEVTETGGPPGTRVEVRDLFYNTPARRRFLKRTQTELARALDVLQRLALAHLGVGFVVTHDGRRLFDIEAGMDLRARVRRTFGAELAEALVDIEARDAGSEAQLELRGLVAPPRFARRDSSRQMWFLNGRPLRDRLLAGCLKEAYRGSLFEGRQPVAFLQLSLDPARVDVNVHPAKAEVRFRDSRRVFGFCLSVLREAVRKTDMATPGAKMVERALRREEREDTGQALFADPPSSRPTREPLEVYEIPAHAPKSAVHETERAWAGRDELAGPYLRVVETYILREVDEGFEIVDQHALHERITYEGLMAEARAGAVACQRFLVPELVELAREDVALIAEHQEHLAPAGIELEVFGETTVALSAVPARMRKPDADEIVKAVLAALRSGGKSPEAAELLGEVLHSAACRASVMAGDRLSDAEIRSLLERAAELEHDQTCPHGRPTRVRFTRADLEKAFLRRV